MSSVQASASAAAAVRLNNVHRIFEGGVKAVDGISLSIEPGEFISILGPSGCGKSTLLRIIAGLDRPTSGSVSIETPGDSARHRIAYVFQDAHLLPWRNVLRNVALPLELMGVNRAERIASAERTIAQVGLADAIKRYPAQLSGGMRMRVSLARALVTEPRLLLLDEPFAALDEITRQKLDEQLRELWIRRQMTVIFVTHSTGEATFLSNRAVIFSKRPAQLIEDFPIVLPEHRHGSVRATPEFAAQTRVIYEALEKGGA